MESFGFSRQTNRLVKNFQGKIKRERLTVEQDESFSWRWRTRGFLVVVEEEDEEGSWCSLVSVAAMVCVNATNFEKLSLKRANKKWDGWISNSWKKKDSIKHCLN